MSKKKIAVESFLENCPDVPPPGYEKHATREQCCYKWLNSDKTHRSMFVNIIDAWREFFVFYLDTGERLWFLVVIEPDGQYGQKWLNSPTVKIMPAQLVLEVSGNDFDVPMIDIPEEFCDLWDRTIPNLYKTAEVACQAASELLVGKKQTGNED